MGGAGWCAVVATVLQFLSSERLVAGLVISYV